MLLRYFLIVIVNKIWKYLISREQQNKVKIAYDYWLQDGLYHHYQSTFHIIKADAKQW